MGEWPLFARRESGRSEGAANASSSVLFEPGGAETLDIDRAVARADDLVVFVHPFDGERGLKPLGLRERVSCFVEPTRHAGSGRVGAPGSDEIGI